MYCLIWASAPSLYSVIASTNAMMKSTEVQNPWHCVARLHTYGYVHALLLMTYVKQKLGGSEQFRAQQSLGNLRINAGVTASPSVTSDASTVLGTGKSVSEHIGFFARVSRHNSRTQHFQRKSYIFALHLTLVCGANNASRSEVIIK